MTHWSLMLLTKDVTGSGSFDSIEYQGTVFFQLKKNYIKKFKLILKNLIQ